MGPSRNWTGLARPSRRRSVPRAWTSSLFDARADRCTATECDPPQSVLRPAGQRQRARTTDRAGTTARPATQPDADCSREHAERETRASLCVPDVAMFRPEEPREQRVHAEQSLPCQRDDVWSGFVEISVCGERIQLLPKVAKDVDAIFLTKVRGLDRP